MQWYHNCFGNYTAYRVAVITNCVIRKPGKKTNKKHDTFSSTAGARPTNPTILGAVIEEVRAIFAPRNVFDPISSFAARCCWEFVGKYPNRGKMLITYSCLSRECDQVKP